MKSPEMNEEGRIVRSLLLSIFLIVFNGLALLQLAGIGGWENAWESLKAHAQAYTDDSDADGDGIRDQEDPRPNSSDPTGCFYELGTGRIISGGSVTSSAGNLIVNDDGASDGCYQFVTDDFALHQLTVTVPPGYLRAPTCQPPFMTCPGGANCSNGGLRIQPTSFTPVFVGAIPDSGNPGFLESGACTAFYPEVDIATNNRAVLANNIALIRLSTPAPALGTVGLAGGIACLGLIGWLGFARLRRAG